MLLLAIVSEVNLATHIFVGVYTGGSSHVGRIVVVNLELRGD